MQVKINGKAAELPDNSSLKDLLLARELPLDVVIIELNGEIIHRGQWEALKLSPDDSLEVLRIISGG
ncbi:MAG: sulfur carrier protein ThiS [Chloroflexi bacterium]|nr:sulfur carrier protein ThiS [Chloroflexota bacterium]